MSPAIDEFRLAMLMNDASIDQIMALDNHLRVIAWNKACEHATGLSRTDAMGKSFYEVRAGADAFPGIEEGLRMALSGFKYFLPREKSSYAGYYEHHFIPLSWNEEIIGVLVIIHDVAHRIKAENELQNLNVQLGQKAKELQEKSDELARFNWIAAHDLKEPLRKIYTFIEMVATKEGIKLTENGRSNLRRAQSAAQRMGLLTDDIATFTQVAAPNESLSTVSLNELLDEALSKNRKIIEDGRVAIERTPMPDIRGYSVLLQLLFNHMINNAVKFHEDGSDVRVRVSYHKVPGSSLSNIEIDRHAEYHCISFEDNGIGIPEEFHEQIFGIFQRLHPQGNFRGTGMGLPICRKVAAAHKGFITVESGDGTGARFNVYLCADL
jgi:PAS domain S-box-containing protein